MSKIYIGIDNGTSGSIGVLGPGINLFFEPATKKEQDYTKKKQEITRIDHPEFKKQLAYIKQFAIDARLEVMIFIERPRVNPQQFKTSGRALRCLESQLIAFEALELPWEIVDSKKWQKELLPSGTVGAPKLKKASLDVGSRLFPKFKDEFKKQKDADGMLIAEWARRGNL